jgi:hypothetical protein
MAEKKQADEIAHEELNLLTKKPELKQKAHGKNLNSFAVRLIISVLLLIWLSFSAVPHLLELSGRKAPIRTTAEHNVLFEDVSLSYTPAKMKLIALRSCRAKS